jgi:hypothetical protein
MCRKYYVIGTVAVAPFSRLKCAADHVVMVYMWGLYFDLFQLKQSVNYAATVFVFIKYRL